MIDRRKLVIAGAGLTLAPWTALAQPLDALRREMAPSGRLRAAINLGNTVLAQTDAAGAPKGISVDLANELARRLGVPLEMIRYPTGGAVLPAGLARDHWDVAFLAVEAERALEADFTTPYVYIDGTYLVAQGSSFMRAADLDREGVRVAVAKGAAYDLVLTRTLRRATIIRVETSAMAIDIFKQDRLEAAAGIRQALDEGAAVSPGYRVLSDSFQRLQHAMAVPKGRPAALAYVNAFIEELKASGFVRAALDRSGQTGAAVADRRASRPHPTRHGQA
jgi:polar amino acid transport system substrate-binding protein